MSLKHEIINLLATHNVTINDGYVVLDQVKEILKKQLNVAKIEFINDELPLS
jgi:hypothetical protein